MRQTIAALAVATTLAACAMPAPGGAAKPTKSAAPTKTAGAQAAIELPSKIGLVLPSSIVTNTSANIVTNASSNIVAQGGGNYGVLQVSLGENLVAAAVKINVVPYLISTVTVEKILIGLNLGYRAGLIKVGVPFTFRDDDSKVLTEAEKDLPENKLTALLEALPDHARVSIYQGTAVAAGKQVAGLSFTSKTRGTAVFKPSRPDKEGGTGVFTTQFDLDANQATAEGYFDKRGWSPPAGRERLRWIFEATPGAKAQALAFKMRVSAYINNPAKDTQLIEASANFTADGGGAAILGIIPASAKAALGDKLVWFPNDGTLPDPAKPKAHDVYLDPKGLALDGPKAPAAYKALVPADDDVVKPYVTDPAEGDPLADAAFAFPQ
ncbi:MAG: hypothetical protein JWM80_1913 [Cyanobacteria bacterium RYN_339]|nr:hypothetical protein [Cyanobacteria bacterium RYN_339]